MDSEESRAPCANRFIWKASSALGEIHRHAQKLFPCGISEKRLESTITPIMVDRNQRIHVYIYIYIINIYIYICIYTVYKHVFAVHLGIGTLAHPQIWPKNLTQQV